jgi:hypothetical protein
LCGYERNETRPLGNELPPLRGEKVMKSKAFISMIKRRAVAAVYIGWGPAGNRKLSLGK